MAELDHLQGVALLLRQLPSELLVGGKDFADLTVATAAIELLVSRWRPSQREELSIAPISGEDVIHTIRRVLSKCPDESPPTGTADLLFIADLQIRDCMRQDVGAANRALQNAEWKAATLLGGAAIEALLHWKLSETAAADVTAAKEKAISSRKLQRSLDDDLDRWVLNDFIAVARELGVIGEETFKQADTARNYRNFIHPGYAARQKQVCDRATALAVLSGLEACHPRHRSLTVGPDLRAPDKPGYRK